MRILLNDLDKLELSSASARQDIDPNEDLTAIIKVKRREYIPKGVKLRARIHPRMFTGSFAARYLRSLEADKNVLSVALSKPMGLID